VKSEERLLKGRFCLFMWAEFLGIFLCLLFNFSPVDATEWQAFERDGLILNVAPSDTARGENLLRDLIIGRNEIQRNLGGAPEV